MKKLIALAVVGGLASILSFNAPAQDNKEEKTIKGEGMCARCELKQAPSCQNAVEVKEGDKKEVYLLVHNEVSKKFHSNICKGRKMVEVKGTVVEKDGKKEMTPTKIELVKEEPKG